MLVSLKDLMEQAKKEGRAVGAINCTGLESIKAAVNAAEELEVPVILAYTSVHKDYALLEDIGPNMLRYAKEAKVPVGVHLDHGASFEECMAAIRVGFTSVMIDASTKPFEENIAITKEVVRAAHAAGVSVEAELGHMMSSGVGTKEGEGGSGTGDMYTKPEEAREFVQKTGVDALAIAFGTCHGIYLTEPKLDLGRVAQIRDAAGIPLVMHGGSGVSDADFCTAIANGITKINYYTYMAQAGGQAVANFMQQNEGKPLFFHDISLVAEKAMRENVKKALAVFSGK